MLTPKHRKATELRENYLAEMGEQLRLRLQPIETYESIEELRDHLNAMALAHEELGLDSEAAMRAAIRKFGPARELGGSLASVPQHRIVDPTLRTIATPLVLFLAMVFGAQLAFGLIEVIGWTFAILLRCEMLPLKTTVQLSFTASVLASTLAWILPKWKPVRLGLLVSGLQNLLLCLVIYPIYVNLYKLNPLVHLALTATISTFALAAVVSATAWEFALRFPSKRSGAANRQS